MRILHIYRDLWAKGGIPHQTQKLVEGQANLGHEVVTVSLKGKRECFNDFRVPVEIVEIEPGPQGLLDLRTVLRKGKPDIIHFTGLWIPVHQWWLLEVLRCRLPFVISPHGSLSPYGMRARFGGKKTYIYHLWAKKFWHEWLDIPVLRHAAGVHAHSRYEAELLKSAGVTKTFIAPVGVDADWVNQRNGEERKLHDPITFLHLGRLDIYHKGLDLVIEALRLLVKAGVGKKCKVIFVGPTVNDSRQFLQRQATELGKEILDIRQAVWGSDKGKIWFEADYFLNLYRFAGMALAPCEALGQKIPLIASREGSMGDWTTSAQMGFSVPLNSERLYDVFKAALRISDIEYSRLSENAGKFALTCTWENAANRVVQGYQAALH